MLINTAVHFFGVSMLSIGGFIPLTTQDYPGKLACVIFVQGCPWRCVYCHNPHLQPRKAEQDAFVWEDIFSFLKRRQGLLDGVVFSGGEPLIDRFLPEAIAQVKALGFSIGLHTAGCYPDKLSKIIDKLDWVGLDIKAEEDNYASVSGLPEAGKKAFECLDILLQSTVDFECRTTIAPEWLPQDSLERLAERLYQKGVKQFILQPYRAVTLDGFSMSQALPAGYPSAEFLAHCESRFEQFLLR